MPTLFNNTNVKTNFDFLKKLSNKSIIALTEAPTYNIVEWASRVY